MSGIGNGGCEVRTLGYDFNDGTLPYGAALFSRLVERRLDRVSG